MKTQRLTFRREYCEFGDSLFVGLLLRDNMQEPQHPTYARFEITKTEGRIGRQVTFENKDEEHWGIIRFAALYRTPWRDEPPAALMDIGQDLIMQSGVRLAFNITNLVIDGKV